MTVPHALWIGPVAVAGLAAAWLGVLTGWRAVFPATGEDADPLAGRLGCQGCGGCERQCEREREEDLREERT